MSRRSPAALDGWHSQVEAGGAVGQTLVTSWTVVGVIVTTAAPVVRDDRTSSVRPSTGERSTSGEADGHDERQPRSTCEGTTSDARPVCRHRGHRRLRCLECGRERMWWRCRRTGLLGATEPDRASRWGLAGDLSQQAGQRAGRWPARRIGVGGARRDRTESLDDLVVGSVCTELERRENLGGQLAHDQVADAADVGRGLDRGRVGIRARIRARGRCFGKAAEHDPSRTVEQHVVGRDAPVDDAALVDDREGQRERGAGRGQLLRWEAGRGEGATAEPRRRQHGARVAVVDCHEVDDPRGAGSLQHLRLVAQPRSAVLVLSPLHRDRPAARSDLDTHLLAHSAVCSRVRRFRWERHPTTRAGQKATKQHERTSGRPPEQVV